MAASRASPKRFPDEQNLQHLIKAIPDPVLLATEEGRIRYANPLFGHTGEALLGLTIEDLMPARYRERHKPDRSEYHPIPTPVQRAPSPISISCGATFHFTVPIAEEDNDQQNHCVRRGR